MLCGKFSKGKACVAQILANYFVAKNETKVAKCSRSIGAPGNPQYVVSGDVHGTTKVLCKTVDHLDKRAMMLYVLDLELAIMTDDEKTGKTDRYWDNVFEDIVDHVNFHMSYPNPIEKKGA
jgi:hypothetical protein